MMEIKIPTQDDIKEIVRALNLELIKQVLDSQSVEDQDCYMSKTNTAMFLDCSESVVDQLRRAGVLKPVYLTDGKKRGKPVFLKSNVKKAIEELRAQQS